MQSAAQSSGMQRCWPNDLAGIATPAMTQNMDRGQLQVAIMNNEADWGILQELG